MSEQYEYEGEWIDCWQCGGEGEIPDCWEEFACIDPESGCEDCLRRCDICRGKGGWYYREPEPAPDRALKGEGG